MVERPSHDRRRGLVPQGSTLSRQFVPPNGVLGKSRFESERSQ